MKFNDDELMSQLDTFVREYRKDAFCLEEDLRRLRRVRRVEAPEAVLLYCGRVLEVLSGSAVVAIGLPISQPFSHLTDLERFSLIPQVTAFLAHGLRRVANNARHVNCAVVSGEVEVALVYLERWLYWYFCQYRFGPRRLTLMLCARPLQLSEEEGLRQFVTRLETLEFDDPELNSWIQSGEGVWQRSPTVAAVLAELLIEHKKYDLATTVIDGTLKAYPGDLRLLQLRALWLSRNQKLEEAIAILEELRADEETIGIKGGALKRQWERDNTRSLLENCYKEYAEGWKSSKYSNVYLGINAATTALWLNKPKIVREFAQKVLLLLEERQVAIAKLPLAEPLTLGFWDEVTLAEANLLLGNLDAARNAYLAAFARNALKEANIDVAKNQAYKILVAQGKSEAEAIAFFKRDKSESIVVR